MANTSSRAAAGRPPPAPAARFALTRLVLTDFRSYRAARLAMDARPLVLTGPNGAGKTNLLEAVSYLSPGRGLRGARLADVARKPGSDAGPAEAWSVAGTLAGEGGETAFPLMGFNHKGIGGDGIFFVNVKQDGTPDGRSLHAGRPPTGGEKWLLSQFVRARPVYNTPAETLY